MVVMEYISETSSWPLDPSEKLKQNLKGIVQSLQKAGFVHGDLRLPNILVTTDDEVKIINFDWSGKAGEVYYPSILNEDLKWHPGVGLGLAIEKKHDDFMLKDICDEGNIIQTIVSGEKLQSVTECVGNFTSI